MFHLQEGLFFRRNEDASVDIIKTDGKHPEEGGCSARPACCALAESPSKRRNIWRWRENRARRLMYEVRSGWATKRQIDRLNQLDALLEEHNSRPNEPGNEQRITTN